MAIYIGQSEQSGVDLLGAFVCTPSWIVEAFGPDSPTGSHGYLSGSTQLLGGLVVMSEWSEDELRRVIEAVCMQTSGPTWSAVGNRLSRSVQWEFEYRYDEAEDAGA